MDLALVTVIGIVAVALIIHLADERYDRLVVEVDDQADTAARIRQSIGDHSGPSM